MHPTHPKAHSLFYNMFFPLCIGMDGFMHKPFQLQTLMDVINHVQLHRDLTEELERQNLVRGLPLPLTL